MFFFFFLNWCSDLWIYFDVNVHFWSKYIILSVFHYFTPYRRFCFANLLNYSQKIRASSIFLWFSFNKLTNIIFFYPAAVYILVLVLLMNLRLTIGWMSVFFFFFLDQNIKEIKRDYSKCLQILLKKKRRANIGHKITN